MKSEICTEPCIHEGVRASQRSGAKTPPWGQRGSDAYRAQARRHMRKHRATTNGRESAKATTQKYRLSQRDKFNAARRKWLNTDKSARAADRISSLLRMALRKGNSRSKLWKLIGVPCKEFRTHLEEQWKPGMTWENFGSSWCVALIIPKRKFDLTQKRDVRICFHSDNVVPRWKGDVIGKGDVYRRRFP